jgi:ribonuclease Z
MTDHIEAAWEQDIDVRTNGLEQKNRTGYKVHVHDVSAFLVAHGSWKQSFGYKFETADRTVVISGDTGPTDAIAKAPMRRSSA